MDRYYSPSTFGKGLSVAVKRETRRIKGDRLERKLWQQQNKLTKKGDTFMRIEFKEVVSAKTNPNKSGKTYSIYRVKGKALTGKLAGEDWQTQFFASAKDMAAQTKALNPGDIVDVEMKKNGNFWNPQSFTKVEGENSVPTTKADTTQAVSTVSNPRLENLKVAVGIMGPKAKKDVAAEYIMQAAEVADLVQDYVDEKGVFQFAEGTSDGIPAAKEVEQDPDDSLI
jgi:hypothetical protein